MGSSSTGKKHKKERKRKHSKSYSEDDILHDLTAEEDEHSSERRSHKSKRNREHKERHKRQHQQREREHGRDHRTEVIAVHESDSDSSDCVEVPVDDNLTAKNNRRSGEKDIELTAPPPPQLSDYRREKELSREKEREREKRKERERYERERELERRREKEAERERFEQERDRREREYERAREKEKEREREREREREKERDRERDRERYERERELQRRREKETARDREVDRDRNRERERDYDRGKEKDRERYDRERELERRRDKDPEREQSHRERERANERTHSPIPENGAGDVLSIEETNKLRAKLGLKPLEENTGSQKPLSSDAKQKLEPGEKSLSSYKDEWGEFLHKPADNLQEKAEAEKLRDKLKQRKEKRFLEERLKRIKTLGESDEEGDNVSNWVQRNKQIGDMKKEAAKRAKALEEMDAAFNVDHLIEKEEKEARRKAYSDKHLKGLRVDHDMEDFSEGKIVILTLKDKDVLDEEEGDTLVNINMMDDERYRQNVENKKKNPLSYGYNVYEEQYDELGNPIERNILEKYDEDVDGRKHKKKNFVIGEDLEQEREHQRKLLEIKTKLAGKRIETLADTKLQLASETFSEAEITKFKKPKKKVKKIRQKLKAEDLLPLTEEPTERHFGSRNARRTEENPSLETDTKDIATAVKIENEEEDDLQRVLSKARKLKQKENIIKKPLTMDIESIKQEIKTEVPDVRTEDKLYGLDGNIILNATAEFCRTLGDIPTYGMAGNRNEDSNDMMDFDGIDVGEERITARQDEEKETQYGTWNSVNPDEVMQPMDLEDFGDGDVEEVAILDEEPDVGAGVANALRLALSKGYLEKEEHNRPSNSKMAHLQAKNYSIEDKNAGDDDKFGRRDRFHSGPISEFRDKETFKPNVKLEYIDDNGRILNLKEAFRYLSHKFHGKGPGKNKIEKRLKKMEQEGLMKTMSSTDTPLGTLTMLQQKQKETKTPFVVLSGGKQTAAGMGSTVISKYK